MSVSCPRLFFGCATLLARPCTEDDNHACAMSDYCVSGLLLLHCQGPSQKFINEGVSGVNFCKPETTHKLTLNLVPETGSK